MASNNKTPTKLRTLAMTPYELFKLQVQGTYGAFRRTTPNYLPPSFGGIEGQRQILENEVVLGVVEL